MQIVGYVSLLAASLFPAVLFAQSAPSLPVPVGQSATSAEPVWQMQDSGTTAGLRGIDSVDSKVAWASGTGGTVLRTIDGGAHWTRCATPDADKDGATLDFRGVQAWDAQTAIVMASGPGDKSRLYRTNDGCKTWKLLFINPDGDGFWDAFRLVQVPTGKAEPATRRQGVIVGDPVDGVFAEFTSQDGDQWTKADGGQAGLPSARSGETIFAASNSSLLFVGAGQVLFVTGGAAGSRSRLLSEDVKHDPHVSWKYVGGDIPLAIGPTAGAFSVESSYSYAPKNLPELLSSPPKVGPRVYYFPTEATCIAVGGDYKKPPKSKGTAAFSVDGGLHWTASITPPHGYRSAVQWSSSLYAWITVGTNGSDVSRDDGRTWQPLDNGNWNALSLPFVVGPQGRIARLNPAAILLSSPQPH